MIKFKKNFYFGGSMSAIQNDGQGPFAYARTNYDLLFEKDPSKFFDGVGPQKTNDFINNYESDLELLASLGINAIRHSFSWAKLFPNGKNKKPDLEVVKYYHNLISQMKKMKITPMMTLMHFDIPEFITKEGGLLSPTFVSDFVNFAQFILNEYGNELDYIATFNEPWVQCSSCYLTDGVHGQWPLGDSDQEFIDSVENVILANALITKIHTEMQLKSKIGIVLDFNPGYSRNINNPKDVLATSYWTAFREEIFLEPTINGKQSETVKQILKVLGLKSKLVTKENEKLISIYTSKWLGVNYYTPMWIKETSVESPKRLKELFGIWDKPIMTMNKSRGWEISPNTLYEIGTRIKNSYKNIEWMVTENGIAIENEHKDYIYNGEIVDDYRIEFFKIHLQKLHKAIDEGSNCVGYLMWTPIDSWSFMNAYKNRYGLISLDLSTQKRTIKKSGHWWKRMTEEGGF